MLNKKVTTPRRRANCQSQNLTRLWRPSNSMAILSSRDHKNRMFGDTLKWTRNSLSRHRDRSCIRAAMERLPWTSDDMVQQLSIRTLFHSSSSKASSFQDTKSSSNVRIGTSCCHTQEQSVTPQFLQASCSFANGWVKARVHQTQRAVVRNARPFCR